MFWRSFVLTVIAGGCAWVASAQEPRRAIAFVNVNVIPVDRDRIEPNQTVLVNGDRIVAVGRSNDITLPSNTVIINGTGQFLVPGLTDAHVHLEMGMPWAQVRRDFGDGPLYLSYGVTTVMNMCVFRSIVNTRSDST
jgi:dihydroorotase-like cyclic amidohydrolase